MFMNVLANIKDDAFEVNMNTNIYPKLPITTEYCPILVSLFTDIAYVQLTDEIQRSVAVACNAVEQLIAVLDWVAPRAE